MSKNRRVYATTTPYEVGQEEKRKHGLFVQNIGTYRFDEGMDMDNEKVWVVWFNDEYLIGRYGSAEEAYDAAVEHAGVSDTTSKEKK